MALLVPDGVGVRNFVLGPFLHMASHRHSVAVLHAVPPNVLDRLLVDFPDLDVSWHSLVNESDTPLLELLRNALGYAHMRWAWTPLMKHLSRRPIQASSWRRKVLAKAARLIGRIGGSRPGIATLDRLHSFVVGQTATVKTYRLLFEAVQPNVLFCSHQRPARVVAPVLAARSLGIPTATFIFSWDNLSSKGRIAAPFEHFLVWSRLMADELHRFYPDVPSEHVHIVGTPQFECYADESLLWSRKDFCDRIGADATRRLICYSGGDAGNVPTDPAYVTVLMELVRSGRIRGNPQVLLRPSPADDGRRYAAVRRAYPELIFVPPAWLHAAHGGWADVIPLPEDQQLLANLTYHCDLNVNFGSTMTLDFAIRDKPVVNVAFDPQDQRRPSGLTAWEGYALCEHYRPVIDLQAARMARSVAAFAEHVNAYLENPVLDRANRRRFVELEVGRPIGEASRHVLNVLDQIAARGASRSKGMEH